MVIYRLSGEACALFILRRFCESPALDFIRVIHVGSAKTSDRHGPMILPVSLWHSLHPCWSWWKCQNKQRPCLTASSISLSLVRRVSLRDTSPCFGSSQPHLHLFLQAKSKQCVSSTWLVYWIHWALFIFVWWIEGNRSFMVIYRLRRCRLGS